MEDCHVGCCGDDTLACGWKDGYDIPGAVCTDVRAGQLLFHPMWMPHRVPPTNDPDNLRIALAMDFEMDNAMCTPPSATAARIQSDDVDVCDLRHQWHVAERLNLQLLSAGTAFLFHTDVPRHCDRGCFLGVMGRLETGLRTTFARDVGTSSPRSSPVSDVTNRAAAMAQGELRVGPSSMLTMAYLAAGTHKVLTSDFVIVRADEDSATCRLVFADWRAKQ